MGRLFRSLWVLRLTQAVSAGLLLVFVALVLLPTYPVHATDPSSLSVVQSNDSADAGGEANTLCVVKKLSSLFDVVQRQWNFAFITVSGFNINYVEDHGEDYNPDMEEFVATNEWQQVKHGEHKIWRPGNFDKTATTIRHVLRLACAHLPKRTTVTFVVGTSVSILLIRKVVCPFIRSGGTKRLAHTHELADRSKRGQTYRSRRGCCFCGRAACTSEPGRRQSRFARHSFAWFSDFHTTTFSTSQVLSKCFFDTPSGC